MRRFDHWTPQMFPAEGPNATTFGPLAALDRSRVAVVLMGVAAVGLLVLIFTLVAEQRPEAFWILSGIGILIGYLCHRRRSHRDWLQMGLSTVLPLLLTAFFVWVARDGALVIVAFTITAAAALGHVIARLVEQRFGPRRKVLRAAWAGVPYVGAHTHPGAVSFDVRPLFAPVSKDQAAQMRPFVRGSSLAVRAGVLKWLFIIAAPIIVLVLIIGFVDEATKGGDDVQAQLVGFTAFTLLLVFGYIVIAWFGFRGSRHATSLKDHVRYAWFAQVNGFDYTAGPVGDRFGRELSRIMSTPNGGRMVVANAIRATQLPNESSSAGTFFSGFCEFRLPVPLPNLLLVARRWKLPAFTAHAAPAQSQRLTLEGDFNRFFDVYCPSGYERDALYLLTPDVMARLIDGACDFDIEFIDDRLVLRTRRDMVSPDPAQWQRIAVAVNALNDRATQWGRWRDDRLETLENLRSPQTLEGPDGTAVAGAPGVTGARLLTEKPTGVALAGKRLRSGLSVGALLLIAAGGIYLGLTAIANAL